MTYEEAAAWGRRIKKEAKVRTAFPHGDGAGGTAVCVYNEDWKQHWCDTPEKCQEVIEKYRLTSSSPSVNISGVDERK